MTEPAAEVTASVAGALLHLAFSPLSPRVPFPRGARLPGIGRGWRVDVLWAKLHGHASAGLLLRRQNPKRCEARRPARGAADEVRAGRQSEGRQSTRSDDPADAAAAGGRDHPVVER